METVTRKESSRKLLSLNDYDRIIVSFSGGKDSLACLLRLFDLGVPKEKIVLWHQHVDGEPGSMSFMDWPITESYVRVTGQAFDLPVRFQWKVGGFRGEMLRENSLTQPVRFEKMDGTIGQAGGLRGKKTTRRLFPQVSADLSVRYCSSYLKIDVAAMAMNNDPAFSRGVFCFVTGERREESSARAKYAEVEPHRCDTKKRRVDQWRAVIDFSESEVWSLIKKYRVTGHPAYGLGWGRVSCLACIFGMADQWASVQEIAPKVIEDIASYEAEFGKTIKKGLTVLQQAKQGKAYVMDPELKKLAMSRDYPLESFFTPEGEEWKLPSGAYRRCGGPT